MSPAARGCCPCSAGGLAAGNLHPRQDRRLQSAFRISFDNALDGGTRGSKVCQAHCRPHRDARVEGQKPGLGHGRKLRGFLHVEKDVAGPFAIIFGEVDRFRFQVGEDLLDLRSQRAIRAGGVSSVVGDGDFEQHAHVSAPPWAWVSIAYSARVGRYSWRKASMGSMRDARRAGTWAASRPTTIMATTAKTIVTLSLPGRSFITPATKDFPQRAMGAPTTSPAATIANASLRTMRVTSLPVAPSAMRMPISLVRRVTV